MALTIRNHDEASLTLVDKENGFKAVVKFDGCIHLNRYMVVNWEEEEEQEVLDDSANYDFDFHICNVKQLIRVLTEIVVAARSHFGESWP